MISTGKLHNLPSENLARLSVHPRIISLDLSITEENLSLKRYRQKCIHIYIDNKEKDLPYGKKIKISGRRMKKVSKKTRKKLL